MSQPPNTSWSSGASGTKSLTAGVRLSVRRPSRTVPICVNEPKGFANPFRMARMPAIVVVLTAPRPTNKIPSFPSGGAIVVPLVTGKNYIIRFRRTRAKPAQMSRFSPQAREMPTAVDRDRVARDPARLRGDEEGDEGGDLVDGARPPEWMGCLRMFEESGVLRLVHAAPPMKVRHDDARIDGVHADTLRRQVERRRARELIDGG